MYSQLRSLLKRDIVIIVSRKDIAGMNIRSFLLSKYEFLKLDTEVNVPEEWPPGEYSFYEKGNAIIFTIPEGQIFTDYLNNYIGAKLLIFASKHSASSRKKALLVHTTGIFGKSTVYGGNDNQLAIAPSKILYLAYSKIKKLHSQYNLGEYWTGVEVSHHGPTALPCPLIYIESGGTEVEWNDLQAAELLADTINYLIHVVLANEAFRYEKPTFIGIGGPHYASTFIRQLDKDEYYMGHILPKYVHDVVSEDIIDEMWNKTMGKDKIFLIDKKGCNGKNRKKFIEWIESKNYPWQFA